MQDKGFRSGVASHGDFLLSDPIPYRGTVYDWAHERAQRTPQAVAIVEGDTRLSFEDIAREAAVLARAFAASGLQPGDVVAFQLPNWAEAVLINVAIARAGLIANPIVPIYRDRELLHILADCRARLYFIPERFRSMDYRAMAARIIGQLPDLNEVVVLRGNGGGYPDYEAFRQRGLTATRGECPAPRVDADATKLIMYTSGTTGHAKGVVHSHRTASAALGACQRHFGFDAGDCVFMPSPVTHITGYLFGLELMLFSGMKVVLMDRWNPVEAIALIDRHEVSFSVGSTPFLTELVAHAQATNNRLLSLGTYVCGGAAVPPELIEAANHTFANARSARGYGCSEAPNIAMSRHDGTDSARMANTDGRIVNYQIKLLEPESDTIVAQGSVGEIAVRGPQVMTGYLRAEDNAEAFTADGYFRTGDLGWIDAEGYLTVTGRKKDIINRGGEKISAKEIEDLLRPHPAIDDVAIIAVRHARLGETLCAVVVPRAGGQLTLDAVAGFLGRHDVARQKIPERLELVTGLPRTASGKVQKNILRDRFAHILVDESSAAPTR